MGTHVCALPAGENTARAGSSTSAARTPSRRRAPPQLFGACSTATDARSRAPASAANPQARLPLASSRSSASKAPCAGLESGKRKEKVSYADRGRCAAYLVERLHRARSAEEILGVVLRH